MTVLCITVAKRVADWTANVCLPQIYSGSCNVDQVKFTLDEEWSTFTGKKAMLSDGKDQLYEVALNENNIADIPPKISEKPCFMKIGVSGTSPEGQVITSSLLTYQIGKGSSVQAFYGDTAFKSLTEKIEQALQMRSLGSVVSEYYLSDSAAVTDEESNWHSVTQVPTVNMPYLWHRFKFTYTNGQTDYTIPAIISVKGPQGEQGVKGDTGSIENFPIASPTVVGGVLPVTKSSTMTTPVGVDADGKLWTSGTKTYRATFMYGDEVLCTQTITAGATPNYKPTTDLSDGKPFDFWLPQPAPMTQDTTIKAYPKAKFTYKDATGTKDIDFEWVSFGEHPSLNPSITKDTYESDLYDHVGWSTSEGSTTPQALSSFEGTMTSVTLYPVFKRKPNTYVRTASVAADKIHTAALIAGVHSSFPELKKLTYTLSQGSAGSEWCMSFVSGAEPTEVIHPAGVIVGDFEVNANTRVEMSILQDAGDNEKYLVWKEWELDA